MPKEPTVSLCNNTRMCSQYLHRITNFSSNFHHSWRYSFWHQHVSEESVDRWTWHCLQVLPANRRVLQHAPSYKIASLLHCCTVQEKKTWLSLQITVNYRIYNIENLETCVYGSVHRWSILIIVQRDAAQSSLFIILQVHSTCFRCQSHP